MVHDTTVDIGLRIATELLAINLQVIAASEFSLYPKLCQGIDNRRRETLEVKSTIFAFLGDNSVVEVVQIMINSSTTADTTHDLNAMLTNVVTVDFFYGILVTPYDDRRFVNPEQENFILV